MDGDLFNHLEDIRRESPDRLRADALGVLAEAALGNGLTIRLRGEPYQVVLHVDAEFLAGTAREGRCELDGGAGVSLETCRRLACDGSVRVVTHGKGGAVEDVGRRSRKIPLALRSLPAHLRLVSADTAVCLVLAAYGNLTSEGTLW